MVQRKILRMHSEHPRGVVAQNFLHFLNNQVTGRPIVHVAHFFEQTVVLLIFVIDRVFTTIFHLPVRTIQQEEKILGIRIIGVPAPQKQLAVTLTHFFLKAVVIGCPNNQLNTQFLELFSEPIHAWAVLDAHRRGIEI